MGKSVLASLYELGGSVLEVALFLCKNAERSLVLVKAVRKTAFFSFTHRGLGQVESCVLGAPSVRRLSVGVPQPGLVVLCLFGVQFRDRDRYRADRLEGIYSEVVNNLSHFY